MTDQYDINYNQQIIELLPPNKRYRNTIAWLTDCMASTLQYLRDAVLGDYRQGSSATAWAAGTYARKAKVVYKMGVYVSLVDNNTDTPGLTDNWYLQQTFYIGLEERILYNGNNLVLTYALNKWFGTTFRQPGTGTSDIYITTNQVAQPFFLVGYTEAVSSAVGFDGSDQFVVSDYSFSPQYNATVYVPNILIASLGSSAIALLTSFINMYIYAGLTFKIVGY